VTNVGTVNITNVYNKTVINNVTVTHVSYNGGSGGVRAQATPTELAAAHENHIAAIPAQRQHEQAARDVSKGDTIEAQLFHGRLAATVERAIQDE
jgi:hypothetical protein